MGHLSAHLTALNNAIIFPSVLTVVPDQHSYNSILHVNSMIKKPPCIIYPHYFALNLPRNRTFLDRDLLTPAGSLKEVNFSSTFPFILSIS